MNRRASAFSLTDAIVLLFCLAIIIALLLPSLPRRGSPAYRTVCGSNLRSINQAMNIYANSYRGWFPVAGERSEGGHAVGFREGDRSSENPAETGVQLDDNVTASLWMLVRDGSAHPGLFICPATTDQEDIGLVPGKPEERVLVTRNAFDFAQRRNLSYSPINMYHEQIGARWSNHANSDLVLLGDNNASDHPQRATADPDEADSHPGISPNHRGEHQNFTFAGGYTGSARSPFLYNRSRVGPPAHPWASRSVNAMWIDNQPQPPQLGHAAGSTDVQSPSERTLKGDPHAEREAAWLPLLPLHGNEGVSLSGLPLDREALVRPAESRIDTPRIMRWAALGIFLVMTLVALIRLRRTPRHSHPTPNEPRP